MNAPDLRDIAALQVKVQHDIVKDHSPDIIAIVERVRKIVGETGVNPVLILSFCSRNSTNWR